MPKKDGPSLKAVLAQFEQDAFDGKLSTDELPPAGSPINALRAQMALFIQVNKDIRAITKSLEETVNKSLSNIESQISTLSDKVSDVEQYLALTGESSVETKEEVFDDEEIPDGYK